MSTSGHASPTGPVGASGAEKDRQLFTRIIAGDQQAFSTLMGCHQPTCARILTRMVSQQDVVADLLQETFLSVYRQLHRFRFESSLRTWISRVAYTTALQYLRRRRLEQQWMVALEAPQDVHAVEDEPGPPELSQALQTGRQLTAALGGLSEPQRLMIGLHYVEDFDIGEIAQVTGVPRGTVKSHLHRARKVLKHAFTRHATVGELL